MKEVTSGIQIDEFSLRCFCGHGPCFGESPKWTSDELNCTGFHSGLGLRRVYASIVNLCCRYVTAVCPWNITIRPTDAVRWYCYCHVTFFFSSVQILLPLKNKPIEKLYTTFDSRFLMCFQEDFIMIHDHVPYLFTSIAPSISVWFCVQPCLLFVVRWEQ